MKLSGILLSIVMLLGFSTHAGACIINLGNGAFYYTGLTTTGHQNLVNNNLSLAWPALKVNSGLHGSEGHLSDADPGDAVYKGSFMNKLKNADLGHMGSGGFEQSRCDNNNPAPVPEPATLLLLGSGLIGLAGVRKKMRMRASIDEHREVGVV